MKLINDYLFSPDEQQLSSGARELIAVEKAFECFENFFKANSNSVIIWLTDSQVCYSFLKFGSRVPFIQRILLKIKLLEYQFNLRLYPKWVPRTDYLISLADIGSKLNSSSDEYGLAHSSLSYILSEFSIVLTVDAFASSKNFRAEKFISATPQINCHDVDFFSCFLSDQEFYYIHCPVKLINRTINKLILYPNLHCLMIVPCWPSHSFWNCIANSKSFKSFVKKAICFNPFYISFNKCKFFTGYKNFYTLALWIETSENNSFPLPTCI